MRETLLIHRIRTSPKEEMRAGLQRVNRDGSERPTGAKKTSSEKE